MQLILITFLLVATVSCAYGDLCPLIYAPVCGSDGKTYASPCNLYAARSRGQPDLTIVHHGVCNSRVERAAQEDDDCPESSKMGICTLEYAPVCASNGKTYPNKCGMCADMGAQRKSGEEVHLRVVHPGKCGSVDYCLPSDKTGACTDDYRPICGSDGKNYANRCEFCFFKFQMLEKGEVLNMEYEGECQRCPTSSIYGKCPKIYKPVCGSDGKTYNNLCLLCFHIYSTYGFEMNDFTLKHLGAC